MTQVHPNYRLKVGDELIGLIHRIHAPKVFLTTEPQQAVTYSTYEAAYRAMHQLKTVFPSIHVQQVHH